MTPSEFFSWPKIAYSIILIGLITIFVRELIHLWFDRKIYIGRFQVFESGQSSAASERSFSLQVINWHNTLRHLFEIEEKTRKATVATTDSATLVSIQRDQVQEDNTWWPTEVSPINDPKSALADLEITVQGVNVKDILTKLRQWVSPPNEITGVIEKNDQLINGAIEWSKAPKSLEDSRFYSIIGEQDLTKTAFKVACGIIWAQASGSQKNIASVSREEFCDWAGIWVSYVALRRKSNGPAGIEEEDVKKIRQSIAFLNRLKQRKYKYPEIFRLSADLIDMLPATEKTPADIITAQNDRSYYALAIQNKKNEVLAINTGGKPAGPEDKSTGTFVASAGQQADIIAMARPALKLENGKIIDEISDTWRAQMAPFLENVKRASLATGYGFVRKEGAPSVTYFSAFAIAPGIIATVAFGLPEALIRKKFPFDLKNEYQTGFSFDNTASPAAMNNAHEIEQVLYAADYDRGHLAILKISGHNVQLNPPLSIQQVDTATDLTGQYVFTVGYPATDARMPQEFTTAVLHNVFQVKRLMPGRIVSVSGNEGGFRVITSDASTFGGVAGGPVINVQTGRVLAIHIGGKWSEKEGKFAYSHLFFDLLADKKLPDELRNQLFESDIE